MGKFEQKSLALLASAFFAIFPILSSEVLSPFLSHLGGPLFSFFPPITILFSIKRGVGVIALSLFA